MIVTWLHTLDLTGIHVLLVLEIDWVIDRSEREIVKHLGALDHQVFLTHGDVGFAGLQLLESNYRLATLLHCKEVKHRRSLAGIVVQRAHRHLADKGQRALAAHYTVGDDVKRVIVGDKGSQVQTRHILDAVFLADAVGKRLIGTDAVTQCLNFGEKVGMALFEGFTTHCVACVKHGAIGQHQASGDEHAVTVGMRAAVHARSVVGNDTAHHRRAYAGRIGREHAAQGFQNLVDLCPNNTGLQGNAAGVFGDTVVLPVFTRDNQDAVAHALTR